MPTEESKAVVRRLGEALNFGGVEGGLDLFTDTFLYNGQQISRQALRQLRAILYSAVPDARWELEWTIAEGDWVSVRWTMRGTHTGDFIHPTLGTGPASGKPIAATYLDHYRIEGGQIAETWEVRDGFLLQQQFGIVAAPGQPTS